MITEFKLFEKSQYDKLSDGEFISVHNEDEIVIEFEKFGNIFIASKMDCENEIGRDINDGIDSNYEFNVNELYELLIDLKSNYGDEIGISGGYNFLQRYFPEEYKKLNVIKKFNI